MKENLEQPQFENLGNGIAKNDEKMAKSIENMTNFEKISRENDENIQNYVVSDVLNTENAKNDGENSQFCDKNTNNVDKTAISQIIFDSGSKQDVVQDLGKFKDAKSLLEAYKNLEARFTEKCQELSKIKSSAIKNDDSFDDDKGEEVKNSSQNEKVGIEDKNANFKNEQVSEVSSKADDNTSNLVLHDVLDKFLARYPEASDYKNELLSMIADTSPQNNQNLDSKNLDSKNFGSKNLDSQSQNFVSQNLSSSDFNIQREKDTTLLSQNFEEKMEEAFLQLMFNRSAKFLDRSGYNSMPKIKDRVVEEYLTRLMENSPPKTLSSSQGAKIVSTPSLQLSSLAQAKKYLEKYFGE